MGRVSSGSRLQRLEELNALLKSGDYATVGTLAAELGVSQRTLTRDIELLRDRGWPIEADRGRGGGVRLHRNWAAGKVDFDYREAIDLLLSLAIAEKLGSSLFLGQMKAIRRKISATFSDGQRDKIRLLRRRVIIGGRASPMVMSGYKAELSCNIGLVHEAFFELRPLDIVYRSARGERTGRRIEPHYLFLNWPVWYLLSWDHLRQDCRSFRIDRIHTAKIADASFRLRDERQFAGAMDSTAEAI